MPRQSASIHLWTETGALQGFSPTLCRPPPRNAEQQYDWDLDKPYYIPLLRAFDQRRDVTDLAAFISVEQIEQSES